MKLIRFVKHTLFITCYFFILSPLLGQEQNKDKKLINNTNPYISWVSQYPVVKETKKKPKFIQSLYNLIIGKGNHLSLLKPVSVVAKNLNEMFVLDQGNQTLLRVNKKKIDIPQCIRKKENYFTSLVSVCEASGGDLLFTDSRLNKVFRISESGKTFKVFNDTLKLEQPTGIAYSAATGAIWIVETNAHRISIFTNDGKLIKTIGSRGTDTGQFNYPTSIWIDKNGDAYVVDAMNFRVQIFDSTGKFITTLGELGDGSGYFARPKGIATDAFGNIYVADAQFHVVQIFDRKGNFLYRFGSQGRGKEEFWMPSGIYIDDKNYIYVADTYNSRIQVFQLINGG